MNGCYRVNINLLNSISFQITGTNSQRADTFKPERYPSGQRGQTVNLLAMPSEVRILPSPPGLPADDLNNFSPVDDSSPAALRCDDPKDEKQ